MLPIFVVMFLLLSSDVTLNGNSYLPTHYRTYKDIQRLDRSVYSGHENKFYQLEIQVFNTFNVSLRDYYAFEYIRNGDQYSTNVVLNWSKFWDDVRTPKFNEVSGGNSTEYFNNCLEKVYGEEGYNLFYEILDTKKYLK